MSPSDFEPYDFTPELTESMEQLTQLNTALVIINRIERDEPELMTDDLRELRVMFNDLIQRMMPRINDLIRREEHLRRGL